MADHAKGSGRKARSQANRAGQADRYGTGSEYGQSQAGTEWETAGELGQQTENQETAQQAKKTRIQRMGQEKKKHI